MYVSILTCQSICQDIDMVKEQQPQIGYMLKHAQSLLRTRMDDVLKPFGLTVPQYACLELLRRDPGISAAELARSAFVTRQSMNALLQTLLDRGLVERPERPESGRALPAVLTPEGRQALGRAQGSVDDVERRMLSGLTERETSMLANALGSCVAALDGPA
jgi:DNA-binding MarR family transcriptional regulator